ncbi:MAG: hypothetical protein HYY95_18305 [Candidatus Rokubacteria bacterium]|nr:hypothetical protein [Candidatus Rokubacteria bacterium]
MAATILLGPVAGRSQEAGTALDETFRVEWTEAAAGPRAKVALQGRVHNNSTYRVGGVRLRVAILDGSGRVVSEAFGWVYGDIPAGGDEHFLAPLPRRGEAYRVSVESFFRVSVGGR